MNEEFRYFERDGQWFPIVEIKLAHGDKKLAVKALIDSGASFSVFRAEIAEYLGVQIEQGEKMYLTGIGGRILGYLHALPLTIGALTIDCKIIFSPELTVSFNLLGRDNFFLPFTISFLEKQKKIVLRKI